MKSIRTDQPFVSVIIPTYNRANCVGEAIDSVLAQSYQNFELIVVDDGSMDNTPEVLAKYGKQIRVIRQENQGVSAARNAGIMAARGEWIAFLDSDDIWYPEKLKVQIQDVTAYPNVVGHVVDALLEDYPYGKCTLFELRGLREEFRNQPIRQRPLLDVLKTQFFTSCWMVKSFILKNVGFFNQEMTIYEDLNFFTRVALEGSLYVNPYTGTIKRRLFGDNCALSNQHQTNRLFSLNSLVKTYTMLVSDKRLNRHELKVIRRYLGGVWCEIAEYYKKKREWRSFFQALESSIKCDPGFRSVGRATLSITGIREVIEKKLRLRRKTGFRSSEVEKGQFNKNV